MHASLEEDIENAEFCDLPHLQDLQRKECGCNEVSLGKMWQGGIVIYKLDTSVMVELDLSMKGYPN